MRLFKLKKSVSSKRVGWLKQETIYEGKLMSMTGRIVRLFSPESVEPQRHVDISYDWVTPVR